MSTWLDNNDAGLANVFVSSMPTWGNGSPSLWRTCLHVDNDHCLQRRGTGNVDTALSCKGRCVQRGDLLWIYLHLHTLPPAGE